jgi:hypothetical protein
MAPLPVRIATIVSALCDQRPGHDVAVAVQIFCGRMHDDVGAKLSRPRQHRGGNGAVDGKARASATGDLRGCCDIGDRPGRVRRALDPNQLGPTRLHRRGEPMRRAGVDKIDDQTPFRCRTLQPIPQSPIHDLRRDDMVARSERQEYGGCRRHSGCKGEAGCPALELGQ